MVDTTIKVIQMAKNHGIGFGQKKAIRKNEGKGLQNFGV